MAVNWLTLAVATLALIASVATWASSDRIGIERRVAAVEASERARQDQLTQIQEDVREIRQHLLGKR